MLQRSLRLTSAFLCLLGLAVLLTGCIPVDLQYLSNPRFPETSLRQLLHFAFLKPWVLLPAMWAAIFSPSREDFVIIVANGILYMFFATLVGGVHAGIGYLLKLVCKEIPERSFFTLLKFLLATAGDFMLAYGAFIWLSCLGASLVALAQSVLYWLVKFI